MLPIVWKAVKTSMNPQLRIMTLRKPLSTCILAQRSEKGRERRGNRPRKPTAAVPSITKISGKSQRKHCRLWKQLLTTTMRRSRE